MELRIYNMAADGCVLEADLIIVGCTEGMPPELPQSNTLKVQIPFASIEAMPICLRNPEALFSTLTGGK